MGNVYQVLYETDVDETILGNWVDQYDLYNNTLGPGVTGADELLTAFDRRECAFIIETGCMTVLHKQCSSSSAEQALTLLAGALTQ